MPAVMTCFKYMNNILLCCRAWGVSGVRRESNVSPSLSKAGTSHTDEPLSVVLPGTMRDTDGLTRRGCRFPSREGAPFRNLWSALAVVLRRHVPRKSRYRPRVKNSDMQVPVLDRFLRYVGYDTQSREGAEAYPSTPGQLILLRDLLGELQTLGLSDVTMDEHGYVTATIPPTTTKADVPAIGFIAHVDTSPEMSGAGVRPIVHRSYDGSDIVLPDDPDAVLRVIDSPYLGECIGHDIVTASGLTLLGADNKSGVAEIMTAAEYLLAHADIPHGAIRIAFTPDEEVGQGTKYFDVPAFGAHCAYTMDGGARGELEFESFSADAISLTFRGFNTHPGFAKGRMVNAIKLAARFIERLPPDRLSPETTEGLQGFVHPYVVQAAVDRTTVKLLVRDFVTAGLQEKEAWLVSLAREVVDSVPGASVEPRVEESYRNMRGGARLPPARRGLRA